MKHCHKINKNQKPLGSNCHYPECFEFKRTKDLYNARDEEVSECTEQEEFGEHSKPMQRARFICVSLEENVCKANVETNMGS